ncbi:MAG TPA: YceI family protein [Lapillicoccus sp.]|nr:YceI family protein [Lapillicoccus sp.]
MDDQLATQLASAMTSIAPGSYRTDATTASATFTVKEKLNLLTVPGRIPVVRADVAIDADGLPRGTATLDVAAITTPNAKRDRDLQGRRFFDTATFPLLDFRSVSTRRSGDEIVVDGLLTVRGEDCPLSLVVTLAPESDGTVVVHATGTFDRMTSPLRGAPRWIIGATVDIVVDAVLTPASR